MRLLRSDRSPHAPYVRLQISQKWSLTITIPTLIFGLLSCSFLAAIQYCRHSAYRDPTSYFFDPTSYFFDPSRAYNRPYSGKRTQDAEAWIQEGTDDHYEKAGGNITPKICVGIVTVARRNEQYVGRTLGLLLLGLSSEERRSIFVDVLIGHTKPSQHPDGAKDWMRVLPDRVLKYDVSNPSFAQLQTWEEEGRSRNKTIFDYILLLRDCYETGAEYLLMAEDDVIAAEGWFRETLIALQDVETTMHARSGRKWSYLRLFYIDDLLGWNSESWLQYLFWSLTIWATLTGSMVILRRASRVIRESLTEVVILTVSAFFIPAFITLYFMAGRHTVQPLSSGIHEMNEYGCCSQGLVFPRSIVPELLARTDLVTDWLVDMMIEQISNKEDWIRWAITPPVLQHTGATSSKGYGFDNAAKELWNFHFEERPLS